MFRLISRIRHIFSWSRITVVWYAVKRACNLYVTAINDYTCNTFLHTLRIVTSLVPPLVALEHKQEASVPEKEILMRQLASRFRPWIVRGIRIQFSRYADTRRILISASLDALMRTIVESPRRRLQNTSRYPSPTADEIRSRVSLKVSRMTYIRRNNEHWNVVKVRDHSWGETPALYK